MVLKGHVCMSWWKVNGSVLWCEFISMVLKGHIGMSWWKVEWISSLV